MVHGGLEIFFGMTGYLRSFNNLAGSWIFLLFVNSLVFKPALFSKNINDFFHAHFVTMSV